MVFTFSLSSNKLNLIMANTFNNEVIRPFYLFITFEACSVMVSEVNHRIVYFIVVGQDKLPS